MRRPLTVSDSVLIAVTPQAAWEAVADVTQMGRWSPENTGARVEPEATEQGVAGRPLAVGTPFVGTNRRGRATWSTQCTVTAADPGERFAFRVHRIGLRRPVVRGRIATWEYRFEEVDGSTKVTETWTDDRPWPDAVARIFDAVVTGGQTFADFQQGNIRRTLARLKAQLEQG